MNDPETVGDRLDYWLLARFSRMQVAYIYAGIIVLLIAVVLAFLVIFVWAIATYAECLNLAAIGLVIGFVGYFMHVIAKSIVNDLPTRKPHEDEKAKRESP